MSTRVLIVDGAREARAELENGMLRDGYDVLTAEQGDEALRILLAGTVEACVLNYETPGTPCENIMEEIRRRFIETPVVITSSDDSGETERRARMLSPLPFFVKPYRLDDLLSVMRQLLGNAEARHPGDR